MMEEKLALIDWDGTMRKNFTIIDWIEFLVKNNKNKNINILKTINTYFLEYKNKIITHDKLAEIVAIEYANYICGMKEKYIEDMAHKFLLKDKFNLFAYTTELFEYLATKNIKPIIISGCPLIILNSYNNFIKVDSIFGLNIATENGYYTNKVLINPGMSKVKETIVNKLNLVNKKAYVAFGNSTSDIPLFNNSMINIVINNNQLSLHSQNKQVLINNENTAMNIIKKVLS